VADSKDRKFITGDDLRNFTLPAEAIDVDELRQILNEHGREIETINRVRVRDANDN
jgi:hypothetical protein